MYLLSIVLLVLAFPLGSIFADHALYHPAIPLMMLVGKWFVFWACGVRLFIAGLRQAFQPRFTATALFGIESDDALPFIQELGMANISMGVLAIVSLEVPSFVLASAIASGLFYGFAGLKHLIRGHKNSQLRIAMVSDLFIFAVLATYVVSMRFG